MVTIQSKEGLQNELHAHRQGNQKIALVPTMGALHEGHLSLIQEAQQLADIVVCSIFVNPTQFNDPKDLEKYPRPIENDMKLLKDAGCNILFMPTVDEMYPSDDASWHIDLGRLDSLWEGEKRPGHFQGVTQIVYKLFRLVEPDIACFGQKDFQQVMVIQRLVELKELPVHIHICPTVRSKEGLALSSRNTRLSETGKQKALAIFRSLSYIKAHIHNNAIPEVKEEALHILTEDEGITVEYLAVCTARTLEEATQIEPGETYVALVVAWIEGVRLIDNMILT
ncbi:pantoate--beta-alanine ligase [Sphingobacterium paludis]|uniref:Pantothenate synthetase n=1 Tax=Sphingobacterium paludis TaxID=1476465 RepID=A0A4R7D597_9SPHI|nr:pantoate--beta-alanine ligase [Sphingobacterium paludis]TDS15727.1 pantoate--beta-alanine ligase [Sphingobacterium paludis]